MKSADSTRAPLNQLNRGRSAVFVGLARDCASMLLGVLDNVRRMASLFEKTAFVFGENDSRDTTRELLRGFADARANAHVLVFDGIDKRLPQRTRRLAFIRNRCLSFIRTNERLRSFDRLVMLDMDGVNAQPLSLDAFSRALCFLDKGAARAGVFANSRGFYYDLWALREPARCPGDVWEETWDYATAHGVDDNTAFNATFAKRVFGLSETAEPIEVTSAFGGLGIYKMSAALPATYRGEKRKEIMENGKRRQVRWQVCEHVSFNRDIVDRGGRLFILPYLCNRTTTELDINSASHRFLAF